MLSVYLLKLVSDDEYTINLMNELFIFLIKGEDFKKDTYEVVRWATCNWLTSEYGVQQFKLLIINEVMKDKEYVLPNI